jgi:TonB family protein
MSAERRFRIATTFSVVFHGCLIVLIGLLGGRAVVTPEILIPVELTVVGSPDSALVLGGAGEPEAPVEERKGPPKAEESRTAKASDAGGSSRQAPAAPKILTAKSSKTPAGATGEGRHAAGEGGRQDAPAGPTYGPSVLANPDPTYPKHAMDQGLEGTVTLSVSVGENGEVQSVSVVQNSTHRALDDAAQRAVRDGWRFKPGMTDGKAAPGKVTVRFEFAAGTAKKG